MASQLGVIALLLGTACGDNLHPAAPDAVPDASIDAIDAPRPVAVRILGFNDFHGAIVASSSPVAPGAAAFAATIKALRREHTIVVAAGDLIGGTPFESAVFHDEPTIHVMNAIGIDYVGVGNHEFDEGTAELLRMQNGGCHPVDGCRLTTTFSGAQFQFLAANVTDMTTGMRILPPYAVHEIGGVRIGIVGLTLEGTPGVTLASEIPELAFADEADTVATLEPMIEAMNTQTIVAVIHEGGSQSGGANGCVDLAGPIGGIVDRFPDAVAVTLSGHSHQTYNCTRDGKLLTSAGAQGRFVTVVDLEIDPVTNAVISAVATNEIVGTHGFDPDVEALVQGFETMIAAERDRVVATIEQTISTAPSLAGETPMGDVIADAMLAKGASQNAVGALMNTGGIRAGLLYPKSGQELVDGQVTYGEAFAVQPFANLLSLITVTGAEIIGALDASTLQTSGIAYTWHSASLPRVGAADVSIGGVPIVPADSYQIVVNSIVLTRFPNATAMIPLGVDLDALVAHMAGLSPVPLPAGNRITTAP